MPGGGTRLRSCVALERELQTKLNQTRVVVLAGDDAKRVRVIRRHERSSREPKLYAVKRVEELSSEFNAELIIRAELGSLEDCQIPVVNSLRSERWINT